MNMSVDKTDPKELKKIENEIKKNQDTYTQDILNMLKLGAGL